MAIARRPALVLTIRQRLLHALQIGAVGPGDRLPTTRALARELRADPRVVADAYRVLAEERLVELRPRSGVFVHAEAASHAGATARALAAARRESRQRGGAASRTLLRSRAERARPAADPGDGGRAEPGSCGTAGRTAGHATVGSTPHPPSPAPPPWLADVFAAAIAHGIPAPDLPRALRGALGSPPAEVAVLAGTLDQLVAVCRELVTWTGVRTQAIRADLLSLTDLEGGQPGASDAGRGATPELAVTVPLPRAVARAVRTATLFVATEGFATPAGALAARLGRPLVVVRMRPDLYEAEWKVIGAKRAWLLVADARFGAVVEGYLAARGAPVHVEVRVVGRDALDDVPAGAPVYATQAARERLSPLQLPRRLLPPVRTLSDASLREVLRAVLATTRDR